MSLEKAVSSAYAAGCRLVFASGAELAAPEDMRVFRCADAHTAVYAALGASLAGRRALVALGEAVELPDSRVTGGVAVLMPGAGESFASLREAFAASESGDAVVALAPDADYAAEADSPEAGRYHKQPERFVAESAREEMCPGCPYRGVYYAAAKLWLRTIGDGGCSLLGGKRPFLALDAAWGRGTAAAALAGFTAALPESARDTAAVTAACDLSEGGLRLLAGTGGTLIIVDEKKGGVDPAELCRRCGIEPAELAANDINGLEAALRAVPGAEGARVIIVRGECALLNMGGAVRTYETDVNRCRRCGACSKLGCPAISGRSPVIDAEKCVGCGMCASVCKCSAIREGA